MAFVVVACGASAAPSRGRRRTAVLLCVLLVATVFGAALSATAPAVNHGARGHTTKIILWGSRSSIVISRRHKGEATTSTTSPTSTLVGAHPCLLIPKAQITSNHYFPKESPFD